MIFIYNFGFYPIKYIWNVGTWKLGEDPGFPVAEGTNPLGNASIQFCQIFQKRNTTAILVLGEGARTMPGAPPRSATENEF